MSVLPRLDTARALGLRSRDLLGLRGLHDAERFGGRMTGQDARLAASNHHPLYPPPAFMDETHLLEIEATRTEAEEIIEILHAEGVEVPAAVAELVYRETSAMVAEIRHLRGLMGWEA